MNYNELTVVLPTINEEETIGKLISYLTKSYRGVSVLVVDDGSADRTSEIVRTMSKKDKKIKFVDRRGEGLERGLTNSVIDGISRSRSKFVISMDADLQHPPDVIKRMAHGFDTNHTLVVATRADVTRWELYRRIISKALAYLGYLTLLLRGGTVCNDIFSGYFGVEKKFFESIYTKNKARFVGKGYKVLFDLLKCMRRGSVEIYEVPYTFYVRKEGSSKATIKQGLALLRSFLT